MNVSFRPYLGLVMMLVAASACPTDPTLDSGGDDGSTGSSDTSMETETGSSTDASSASDATEAGCACVAVDGPLLVPGCAFEEACEPVLLSCTEPGLPDCTLDAMTVLNPEVLPCHHDALVGDALVGDATAMLRWELPDVADPGVSGQRRWVLLVEDARVVTWHEAWGDGAYAFSDAVLSIRRNAAHFDDCMTRATPEQTFVCLFDVAQDEIAECKAAYEVPFD